MLNRLKLFILNTIAANPLLNFSQRRRIYELFGLPKSDCYIEPHCYFTRPDLSNVWLGDKSYVNSHCYIDNSAAVYLGKNSCLAPYVKIVTTTHEIGSAQRRVGNTCSKVPVRVGVGCWIAVNATILAGATVKDGAVVAAGAVVREFSVVDRNSLYAGVPAEPKRELTP